MVLASISALYLETQLATLEDQAAKLEALEVQKESQVHALKIGVQQKDELLRDLEAKVGRLEAEAAQSKMEHRNKLEALKREVADAKAEAARLVTQVASFAATAEHCESASRELRTDLHASQHEIADLRSGLAKADAAKQELESKLVGCDNDRASLVVERNASEELRKRVQELEDDVDMTESCCESVPMCNLCRMKMDR